MTAFDDLAVVEPMVRVHVDTWGMTMAWHDVLYERMAEGSDKCSDVRCPAASGIDAEFEPGKERALLLYLRRVLPLARAGARRGQG